MNVTDPVEKSEPSKDTQPELPRLSFDQLCDGRSEIIIEHQGQQYRLRTTRNGGLILNK